MGSSVISASPLAGNSETVENKGTTERVLALLMLFADAPQGITGNMIATKLGLGRATTYRMLAHLQRRGLVDHLPEQRLYVPGAKLHRLAFAISTNDPLLRIVRREVRKLVEATGETATFALYDQTERCLSWVILEPGSRPLSYIIQLNRKHTLVWGASGRAILSMLPRDLAAEIIAAHRSEKSVTGALLPSVESLLRELDAIANRGFATSLNHVVPHAFAVACPVMRGAETVVGAIALSIPEMHAGGEEEHQRFGIAVKAAAARICEALTI